MSKTPSHCRDRGAFLYRILPQQWPKAVSQHYRFWAWLERAVTNLLMCMLRGLQIGNNSYKCEIMHTEWMCMVTIMTETVDDIDMHVCREVTDVVDDVLEITRV